MIDGRHQLAVIPMRDYHLLTKAVIESLLTDGEVDQIIVFDNETEAVGGRKWLKKVTGGVYGPAVQVRQRSGDGVIYELWNEAWREAVAYGQEHDTLVDLTVMNNDIKIPEGMIGHLSRALRGGVLPASFAALEPSVDDPSWVPLDDVWIVYPDYRVRANRPVECSDPPSITPTIGTFRKHGMSGFCFMLKPEMAVLRGWPYIDEQFKWYCGDGDLVQQAQMRGATAARVEGLPLGFQTRTTSHNSRNRPWVEQLIRSDMRNSKRKYPDGGSFPKWRERWGRHSTNG